MKYFFLLLLSSAMLYSCQQATDTAKQAINKTGEIAGKGASEFAHGFKEGVDQTFQCQVQVSKGLFDKGIRLGKFKVTGDSVLTVYVIFDNDFKGEVHSKVLDIHEKEYGRTMLNMDGKKGDAKYYDFTFGKPVEIESMSKFMLE